MARSNLELPRWPDDASDIPAHLNPGGILGGIDLTPPDVSGVDFLTGPKIPVALAGDGFNTGLAPYDPNSQYPTFPVPNEASAEEASPPAGESSGAEVGEYYLPGVGRTYLEPQFAGKVADFILRTQGHGIPLRFTSGYRNPDRQAALRNDPNAITPASNSLHPAGRGVDISWKRLSPAQREVVLSDAASAGLSWGGKFRNPDPVHFYSDPGTDRRQLIDSFSQSVTAFRNRIPDR